MTFFGFGGIGKSRRTFYGFGLPSHKETPVRRNPVGQAKKEMPLAAVPDSFWPFVASWVVYVGDAMPYRR